MRRLFAGFALATALSVAATAQEVIFEVRSAELEAGAGLVEMLGPDGRTYYVGASPVITNAHVASATVGADTRTGSPQIRVVLTPEGAEIFSSFTAERDLKLVAIVIDGVVVLAPKVMGRILGGVMLISGNFTMADAERIADGIVP